MTCTFIGLIIAVGLLVSINGAAVGRAQGNRLSQTECLADESLNQTSANRTREGRRLADADTEALSSLFAGEVQFSLDLFKAVYNATTRPEGKRSDNLIMSPMSVYSALLLTYFGSHGRTEEQISQLLGFNSTKVEVVQAYKFIQFTRQLMRAAGLVKYDFDIANRVYFDAAEPVRQCMRDIFDEDLVTADFAQNDTEARLNINQWVEQLTQGKIQDLATPDIINSQTRMAIINAAYFKGQWASQFKTSETRLTPFRVSMNDSGLVNMMFQKGNFRHTVSEELQAHVLEMPFLGNDVSFYVILPEGPGGLDETLRLMDADTLRLAMSDTFPFMMEVGIPKFRLEQTLSLDSILVPMGLTDLFDASVADLSAFNGVGGLSMDAATHKAFIEVNEEGSEAAAATAMVSLRMARPLGGSKVVCDRPFIYFIHDTLSDSILFMGIYRNPKQH